MGTWGVSYRPAEVVKPDPLILEKEGKRLIKGLEKNRDYVFEITYESPNQKGIAIRSPVIVNSGNKGQALVVVTSSSLQVFPFQ